MICGDANPKGNFQLTYRGGCRKHLKQKDAYRCTGCGGYFHKECIFKHFELEKKHDYGKEKLRTEIIKTLRSSFNFKSETLKDVIKIIKKA